MISARVMLSITSIGLPEKIKAMAVEYPQHRTALLKSKLLLAAAKVNAGDFAVNELDIETRMWFLRMLKSRRPLQLMVDGMELSEKEYKRLRYVAYLLDKGMASSRTIGDFACPVT